METIAEMYARLSRAGWPCAYHDDDAEEWLVTGIGRNRDSRLLDRVNFDSACARLERAGVEHTVKRAGHWAVGWVEDLVIRVGDERAIAAVTEIRDALENYPILDEEAYSAAEDAATWDDWRSYGAREFRRAMLATHPEVEDADDETLWAMYQERADRAGVWVERDGEGACFRIERVSGR